jgi:hypothetical protein
VSRSQSFKQTENSLENYITITYIIDSETVETEAPVCAVHHKKGFTLPTFFIGSRGSVVGITTRYGLEGPGIESRWGEIFRTYPDRLRGPPSLLCSGYRVFPGAKAAGA